MKALHSVTTDHDGRRPRQPLRYARVFFDVRATFGISLHAYVLLEVIDVLSRKRGWCYASKRYVASALGISRKSVQRLVTRLHTEGLIEKHETHRGWLRPTSRWREAKQRAI